MVDGVVELVQEGGIASAAAEAASVRRIEG